MLGIIIKTTLLSILFIYIVHKIIQFLTDSITVPKTKDLVSIIEKKYDEIHNTLQHAPRIPPDINTYQEIPYTTHLQDLPTTASDGKIYDVPLMNTDSPDIVDMKSELQLFIKQTQYN